MAEPARLDHSTTELQTILKLVTFRLLAIKLTTVLFTDLKLASTQMRFMLARTGTVWVATLTVIGLQAKAVPVIEPFGRTWLLIMKLYIPFLLWYRRSNRVKSGKLVWVPFSRVSGARVKSQKSDCRRDRVTLYKIEEASTDTVSRFARMLLPIKVGTQL